MLMLALSSKSQCGISTATERCRRGSLYNEDIIRIDSFLTELCLQKVDESLKRAVGPRDEESCQLRKKCHANDTLHNSGSHTPYSTRSAKHSPSFHTYEVFSFPISKPDDANAGGTAQSITCRECQFSC